MVNNSAAKGLKHGISVFKKFLQGKTTPQSSRSPEMILIRAFFAIIAILLFSTAARSVELDKLTSELVIEKQTKTEYKLAFWLPPDLFLEVNADASDAEKKQLSAMLEGYAIFLVANAKIGLMGALSSQPRSEILATTFLYLDETTKLSPMPDAAIKGDIKVWLEMVKPVFKGLAGNYGDALEAVVFKDQKINGQSKLSATSSGKVQVSVAGEYFTWRLPLVALLPAAIDPVTGEKFPGNFLFNPYTGLKLQKK